MCRASYRVANLDRVRARDVAYREANHDKYRARNTAYYEENRSQVCARVAAWKEANPEQNAAHGRDHASRRRARKRAVECDPAVTLADVIALWGDECYLCGVMTDPAAPPRARYRAELEHVVPLSAGGSHTLRNLRCACYPCNAVKGHRLTAEQVREMFA